MKRFVIDSILILLLVMIGSSYLKEDSMDVDKKLDQFEERIEDDVLNYDTSISKATALAKNSSDLIESVVGMSVELITRFFSAIIE